MCAAIDSRMLKLASMSTKTVVRIWDIVGFGPPSQRHGWYRVNIGRALGWPERGVEPWDSAAGKQRICFCSQVSMHFYVLLKVKC